MCAICGGRSFDEAALKVFHAAKDRGRDYSNIFYRKGSWICNHRAVPTTEVENAEFNQPFGTDYKIVHNGTIANDKELGNTEGMIDSYILSKVLDCNTIHTLSTSLQKVKGSYAIAILKPNGRFYLACNYKPIFYANAGTDNFIFSSYREHLEGIVDNICRLAPYSILDEETGETLELTREDTGKAVVVCSGGLDSTAVAAYACDKYGASNVTLIHYAYGCIAETKEISCIKNIANALHCDYTIIPIDMSFMNKQSALFGDKDNIHSGISGAEYAYEWVPARNLIMLSLAVGFCEANGYSHILLGTNLEEGGCLAGDTKIKLKKGNSYKECSIGYLYDNSYGTSNLFTDEENGSITICTVLPNGHLSYVPIDYIYCSGVKPLVRITLEDGTQIKSSLEHEWYTQDGYVQTGSLQVGDYIWCNGKSYENMTEEEYSVWKHKWIKAVSGDRNPNKMRVSTDKSKILYNLDLVSTLEDMEECVLVSGMVFHPNVLNSGKYPKYKLEMEATLNNITLEEWVHRICRNEFHGDENFLPYEYDTDFVDYVCILKKVVDITEIPPEMTYDISVRGTHNYVANGAVGHNSYPDNENQFIKDFNSCLYGAVQNGKYVDIETPVGNLMKHEIVQFGNQYNAPFQYTWSCYKDGEFPCHDCGPCYMREKAFERNGLVDPLIINEHKMRKGV